jgi:hypothetical protein
MVTGQLLRLSSAMSGGVLDIRHHTVAIDYMNVHFLISYYAPNTYQK